MRMKIQQATYHPVSILKTLYRKQHGFPGFSSSLEHVMSSDANTSVLGMALALGLNEPISLLQDQPCALPTSPHPISAAFPPLAPVLLCSSFQRSTTRCSIMGRSRNWALRKLPRSWCWPRRWLRRFDVVHHSSPRGSLWMRKLMRPRNVGVFNSGLSQHTPALFVGPGKNSKQKGNVWSSNQVSIFQATYNLYIASEDHSGNLDYKTKIFRSSSTLHP